MSSEFAVSHTFDCSEETFWERCLLSDDFNKALYLDSLKFPGWRVLEQNDTGTQVIRKIHIDPPVTGLPGPVKKLLGDRFSYVEQGTYDRATQRYTFKVIPSTLAEKTKTEGVLWTEKKGEHQVVRHARLTVDVKVFAVGKLVEDKVLGDLKSSYEAATHFTRAYLTEHGLS